MGENVIRIAALGRQFQVGDFYDYQTDCVAVEGNSYIIHFAIETSIKVEVDCVLAVW